MNLSALLQVAHHNLAVLLHICRVFKHDGPHLFDVRLRYAACLQAGAYPVAQGVAFFGHFHSAYVDERAIACRGKETVVVEIQAPVVARPETATLFQGEGVGIRADAYRLLGEARDDDPVRARPFRCAGIGKRERCTGTKRNASAVLADRQNANAVRRAVRHRQRTAVDGIGA